MPESILKVVLQGDATKLNASLKTASSRLESFGKKVQGIGKSMSIYVTAPITLAGGAAIKFASDFEESLNKVDVAFKNSSGEVRDFAKTTLKSFGIAEGTALDMAALFGDMGTSMGLSTNEAANLSTSLVGLAGDLSSFKNMNIEEVTTALNGVFTGETESLKRLGIVMTEVNLQQFALEQGITKSIKKFTQAEKVQLRYNYVMAKTTNAQGDFANTSEGAANQMRIFQETLKELGVEFGQILLPLFTKIITKVNELLTEFKSLDEQTKKIILVIGGVAAAIGPLLIVIGTLTSTVIPALIKGFEVASGAAKLFRTAITAATGPIGLIVTAVIGLGSIVVGLANKIAPNVSTIDQLKHAFLGLADGTSSARLAMAEFDAQREKSAKKGALLSPGVAPTGPNLPGQEPKKDLTTFGLGLLAPNKEKKKIKEVIEEEISEIDLAEMENDLFDLDKVFTLMGQNIENAFETSQIENFAYVLDNVVDNVDDGLNEIVEKTDNLKNAIEVNFGSIAESMGMAFATALVEGKNVFGALSSVIIGAMGDLLTQMGKAAIAASVITATFANPITGLAAGITALALGTALKAMSSKVKSGGFTAFANGGIVSSPTLGLVGEYAGARSNPEVIAPLDKLKSLLGDTGGNNVQVGGEFKLRGDDLYVSLERTKKRRNRIG